MKRSTLIMAKHYQLKKGCYTMKEIEKVSSGKVKYNSLTDKSVIDPTITRFGPYMNKILGISNGNYIDMLLSKKMFSFKINKLSTTDNILNGKPCNILYMVSHVTYFILVTSIKTYHLEISFTLSQIMFSIKIW